MDVTGARVSKQHFPYLLVGSSIQQISTQQNIFLVPSNNYPFFRPISHFCMKNTLTYTQLYKTRVKTKAILLCNSSERHYSPEFVPLICGHHNTAAFYENTRIYTRIFILRRTCGVTTLVTKKNKHQRYVTVLVRFVEFVRFYDDLWSTLKDEAINSNVHILYQFGSDTGLTEFQIRNVTSASLVSQQPARKHRCICFLYVPSKNEPEHFP